MKSSTEDKLLLGGIGVYFVFLVGLNLAWMSFVGWVIYVVLQHFGVI